MRGSGRVFRRTSRGRELSIWWLDYSVHNERHREPSGTTSKKEAQRLLREKMGARENGKMTGRPDRVTFRELRALAERQYTLDGRKSLDRLKAALDHLERVLGAESRAPDLTASRLDTYAEKRKAEGAARATVNYELAAMRRAFRLGIEKGVLAAMPVIKLPKVRNARSGFFADGDFAALVLELPADIQPLVRFLRLTGWRRSEALNLTWDQVDLDGSVIRLADVDTKGGEPRLFPFKLAPELLQLIEARYAARSGPFVFHRSGRRIGVCALRGAWRRACTRAGLGGRIVHDLRRTAARDLRRKGLSEGVIMKLCGWRTRSMFDRYNVIDEDDLARSVELAFNGTPAAHRAPVEQEAKQLS